MRSFTGNSAVAAYVKVRAHGAVTGADPHGLVLMLLNGTLERMAIARGCIQRQEIARKAQLLHSCVTLIGELRGSLNLAQGGELAQNLDDLYDYMIRRLLLANLESRVDYISEVERLLGEIRAAWVAIGPQVRAASQRELGGAGISSRLLR